MYKLNARSPITATVLLAARHPLIVLLIASLLTLASTWIAATGLAVTTDIGPLFAASLPWKQHEAELKRLFPQFTDTLVAVVEAGSPEAADATANGLARALANDPRFKTVRRPDSSAFFDKNGLLFLDSDALEKLLNQTIDAQPFLGQLVADPSTRGLLAALSLVAIGVERGQADLGPFITALKGFDETLRSALAGMPKPLSWQQLLSGPLSDLGGPYRFVIVQPNLDYGALAPGAAATQAIRTAAAEQEFVRDGQARVRVTGSVAIADEEFASAAQGAVGGLIGSTLIVIVWLALAVRSWRLILPIVLTLFIGLLVTTGFAALSCSPLNLISVAFAILFVGIAVDFAIQFSVRYREMLKLHCNAVAALEATAELSGPQILIAAFATSAGFLAFVPTDFIGVAELGLIAGVGMLIAFVCTITILPALIILLHSDGGGLAGEAGFGWATPLDGMVVRSRCYILAVFTLGAVAGLASAPQLRFDSDPLHTKKSDTEAMRTLADLAANPLTNPYTVDILARNADEARATRSRIERLPLVAKVITLDSFVPSDQPKKLALIADAASLLAPTLAPRMSPAPVTAADIRLAAATAAAQLARATPLLPPDHPLVSITAAIKQLQNSSDSVLLAADGALTRFLPFQLDRLRLALQATLISEALIPSEIARDWRLPDGRRRIQVTAEPDSAAAPGLRGFVTEIQAIIPDAGGSAVAVTETANTIIRAFTKAVAGALLAILVILSVALRRTSDVLLVLAPLVLSGLLTVIVVVTVSMPLNFANIIALPLLLGVGVSFNIYFVMNRRAGQRAPLSSPTARAVVFSALTTGTAFSSLALSAHPGTASMGLLLLLSLACSLISSLLFIPALLATIPPHRGATTAIVQR